MFSTANRFCEANRTVEHLLAVSGQNREIFDLSEAIGPCDLTEIRYYVNFWLNAAKTKPNQANQDIDQKANIRYASYNTSNYLLTGSPEERKVAAAIKKQNDEIKKQQEDVHKLLDKIIAAIELSCSG